MDERIKKMKEKGKRRKIKIKFFLFPKAKGLLLWEDMQISATPVTTEAVMFSAPTLSHPMRACVTVSEKEMFLFITVADCQRL